MGSRGRGNSYSRPSEPCRIAPRAMRPPKPIIGSLLPTSRVAILVVLACAAVCETVGRLAVAGLAGMLVNGRNVVASHFYSLLPFCFRHPTISQVRIEIGDREEFREFEFPLCFPIPCRSRSSNGSSHASFQFRKELPLVPWLFKRL